jgi:hypothetical protein
MQEPQVERSRHAGDPHLSPLRLSVEAQNQASPSPVPGLQADPLGHPRWRAEARKAPEGCEIISATDSHQLWHLISSRLHVRKRQNFGLLRYRRRQFYRFAFGRARRAAVQWRLASVSDRHQVVNAECLAAPVAAKLIAAGAEHRAAPRARANCQEDVPAVFVILNRKTFERRVGVAASGRSRIAFS